MSMVDKKDISFKILKYGLIFLLITMPFYAFISVFTTSFIGHYTFVRLYKEFILLFLTVVGVYLIISDKKLRKQFFSNTVIKLIVVFAIIVLVSGFVAKYFNQVTTKSLEFGLIVDLRFFLVFSVSYLTGLKIKLSDNQLIKYIFWPAMIVIVFAIVQFFFLPHNFLSHFGYNSHTIQPFQTINSNSNFVRVISFLRGSNPLGAYLILPITLLAVLFYDSKKKPLIVISALLAIMALIFSFSRSAWLGTALAVFLVFYLKLPTNRLRKIVIMVLIGLVVLFGLSLVVFGNNTTYQNLVFHYSSHSAAATSSDGNHLKALDIGLIHVLQNPLGSGTGTAGPASIYNLKPAVISENYFLQIGIEQGWFGLFIFLLILIYVLCGLWQNKKSQLSLILFCALLGICLVNLFLPEFTDDTISYVLWIPIGLSLAYQPLKK